MAKKLITILVLTLGFLIGCQQRIPAGKQQVSASVNKQEAMRQYLQGRHLPALQAVEFWDNEYGAGLLLKTRHYQIYTTLLEPLMLSQLPGFVESAYRSYQSQLPEPVKTEKKFKVYLFAGRYQWEQFTDSFVGAEAPMYRKIKTGAYYLKGSCVVYNIGRELTFSALGHEGWHQFNRRLFQYRLPSWLDEGVAMLFETSRYDKGLFYFEPANNFGRLISLKKTLIEGDTIPLKKLLGMNPGEAILASEKAVRAFYAQAYALVRFLREDDYGKRMWNYHRMMMAGAEGKWSIGEKDKKVAVNRNIKLTVGWNKRVGTAVFNLYIAPNSDLNEIEQQYLDFCKKIVYHVHYHGK